MPTSTVGTPAGAYRPPVLDWSAFASRLGEALRAPAALTDHPRALGVLWGDSATAESWRHEAGALADRGLLALHDAVAPGPAPVPFTVYGLDAVQVEAVAARLRRVGIPRLDAPVAEVLALIAELRLGPDARLNYLTAWVTQCARVNVPAFRPPRRMQHVTWTAALPGILSVGLSPAHAGDNVGDYAGRAVFLSSDAAIANLPSGLFDALRDPDRQPSVAILDVDLRDLPPSALTMDDDVRRARDWGADGGYGSWGEAMLHAAVERAHEERARVQDATGVREPDWHLSLRAVGTIAVSQLIPPAAIQGMRLATDDPTVTHPFTEQAVAHQVFDGDPALGFVSESAWHLYRNARRRGDPNPPTFRRTLPAAPRSAGAMRHELAVHPTMDLTGPDGTVAQWIGLRLPASCCPPRPKAFGTALFRAHRTSEAVAPLSPAHGGHDAHGEGSPTAAWLTDVEASLHAQRGWILRVAAHVRPLSEEAAQALCSLTDLGFEFSPRFPVEDGPSALPPLVAWLDGVDGGHPILAVRLPAPDQLTGLTERLAVLTRTLPGTHLCELPAVSLARTFTRLCTMLARRGAVDAPATVMAPTPLTSSPRRTRTRA